MKPHYTTLTAADFICLERGHCEANTVRIQIPAIGEITVGGEGERRRRGGGGGDKRERERERGGEGKEKDERERGEGREGGWRGRDRVR